MIHVWWDVALLFDNVWSDLSYMHINHKAVIPIYFKKLIFCEVLSFHEMLDINVFMR